MLDVKMKEELNQILNDNENVFVKFSTSWCGPCKMLAQTLKQIENECPNVKFVEIDVDEAQYDFASDYQVMSVPKVMMFKNNKCVDTFVGALPKNTLIERLKKTFGC
jgi:thioredoxin 1